MAGSVSSPGWRSRLPIAAVIVSSTLVAGCGLGRVVVSFVPGPGTTPSTGATASAVTPAPAVSTVPPSGSSPTASPDWKSGQLAIVVVFDEGDTNQQVPFVLIAPGASGAVMSQPADHYALTRLIDGIIGVQPLRQAASAPRVAQRFGL